MAIIRNFNGASLRKPGAYSALKVTLDGGLPSVAVGIVGIVGESSRGAPGSSDGVTEWDSTQLPDLIEYYGSGPIVDAAMVLVNPSNDGRVANGANRIKVYKANASLQASLTLADSFGDLKAAAYGAEGNLISATIEQDLSVVEATTQSSSDIVFTGDETGAQIIVRENGEAANTYTVSGNMADMAALLVDFNNDANWTSPPTLTATNDSNKLIITQDADANEHKIGGGRSFEIISADPLFNLATGLLTPSQEPNRSILIERQSDGTQEDTDDSTGPLGGDIYMEIGCDATTCTLTISSTQLTTVAVGGPSSLSIDLADYSTLNDLASFIDSQASYSCSIPSGINGGLSPSVLDRVSAVGIASGAAKPGRVKADSYSVEQFIVQSSQLTELEPSSSKGLPDVLSKTFLSGGALGASASSDFSAGFTAMESERINMLIPLISQDASDDIVEDASITDAGSSYDIESVQVAALNHAKKMGNTQNRSERQVYVGYRGTFEECKAQSLSLNSELVSLALQDVQVVDNSGELIFKQPHILACLVAGMQAGAEIGEPATFKYINAFGIQHLKKQGVTPSSLELFDPAKQFNQAIDNGLLIVEKPSSGGIRVVVHNSTYSKDDNFVYNRPSVLGAAFYVAFDLRDYLENIFIGTKARTGSAESIANAVKSRMTGYLREDIIVGDDTNDGLGYKALTVTLIGNTAYVDVTITPVQGIDFILATIRLDNIRQSA